MQVLKIQFKGMFSAAARLVKGLITLVVFVFFTSCQTQSDTLPQMPDASRFVKVVLDQGLDEPMELAVLPNLDVLFIERKGAIKLYQSQYKRTKILAKLSVFSGFEDGLLGLTLDPKFDENGWIYLYYSVAGDKAIQRVSRFKMAQDSLLLASERTLIEIPVQRETCCHSAGSITFGKDGNLYIAVGDNTSSKESDGYTPIDERPGRSPFDAQKSSSNTQDLRGKILRIHPERNGTYTIPDGNLFDRSGTVGRPEIYTMGCRNPYRIATNIKNGWLWWGDVGPDAGVPDKLGRGPESYDEFNLTAKPGNFGWPYLVGNNIPYRDFNFADSSLGALFDPQNLTNTSPNNTGATQLPPATPAWIWYPYGASSVFTIVGTGGRSAMAGPVYLRNLYSSQNRFPAYFDQKIFLYEWMREWILVVSTNQDGSIKSLERFLPESKFVHPNDMEFGPDGSLYILEYGSFWFSQNEDARLVRIEYAEGNRNPIAALTTSEKEGAAPLKTSFSASGSKDYDNDSLSYKWFFTDTLQGLKGGSNIQFTYTAPGVYYPKVRVTDSKGAYSEASVRIQVGNAKPQVLWTLSGNQTFFSNGLVNYNVTVTDREDAVIATEQIAVSIDYIEQTKDLALIESGVQAVGASATYSAGRILIEGSDCKACHATDKKSVGPSFLEISARYSDGTKNATLARKIITGGTGNWGHSSMSAHPQLSVEQATKMVQYIIALGQTSQQANRPTTGAFMCNKHSENQPEGIYIFNATYTDNGANGVAALTGKSRWVLRSPRVQAEDCDVSQNIDKWFPNAGKEGGFINHYVPDAYFGFKSFDLSNLHSMTFRLMDINKTGSLEVRVDAPNGPLLGVLKISPVGPKYSFYEKTLAITPLTGRHDVYFTYPDPSASVVVDWIWFKE